MQPTTLEKKICQAQFFPNDTEPHPLDLYQQICRQVGKYAQVCGRCRLFCMYLENRQESTVVCNSKITNSKVMLYSDLHATVTEAAVQAEADGRRGGESAAYGSGAVQGGAGARRDVSAVPHEPRGRHRAQPARAQATDQRSCDPPRRHQVSTSCYFLSVSLEGLDSTVNGPVNQI